MEEGERRLVVGLKNGKESAYEELLTLYGDRLYGSCVYMTGDPQAAEDIVQETFVRVVTHIRTFQGNSQLYTWMYRIAVNLMKDHWRKQERSPLLVELEGETASDNVEEEVFDRMEREVVRQAIFELLPLYRQVILLFYYERYSIKEMAYILSESENTVKSRLFRGRQLLKDRMMRGEERRAKRDGTKKGSTEDK